MEPTVVLAYVFGLLLLYVLARVLVIPVRMLLRVLANGILGGLLLMAANLVGTVGGFYLPVNPVTALVAGFLGIPGVVLLLVLQHLVLD